MEVKQIYELVNSTTNEILGKSDLVAEDLSNVVDIGTEIFNANAVDRYVGTLVDKVGKVVFVNRPYSGSVPSVLRDSWEYGSVLQKIACELPEASINHSWDLQDGETYSQDTFKKPVVSNKFFNNKNTFEITMSIADNQVKSAFNSVSELNGFLSMIQSTIEKSMTVKIDSLVMRTINNMIGQTFNAEFSSVTDDNYSSVTGIKAVNLLKLYNDKFGTTLTPDSAITNPEFIRFASFTMGLYIDRVSKLSSLFNIGGKDRFTAKDVMHLVTLSEFAQAADVYLQSETFHNEFTKLPNMEKIPYWQGSGADYSFNKTSSIHVSIKNDNTTKELNISGILAVIFDRDALGVCNENKRVKTHYNNSGEFTNYWYKWDSSYFNDLNENFVVFYVQ